MSIVLATGFDPFENEPVNPLWETVRALDGQGITGAEIVARQLPTIFDESSKMLGKLLQMLQPEMVIVVGQIDGQAEMIIEHIVINVDDARIADNTGKQPIDIATASDGPATYSSTLPTKTIVRELRAGGIPTSVSQVVDTFICDHVFYGLMRAIPRHRLPTRGGFIHIPYLPSQTAKHPGQPSMVYDTIITGLHITIETTLRTLHDVRETGGQLH